MEKDPVLAGIMAQLGEWGPYQFKQHLLHLFTSFLAGIHMLSLSFTAPEPDHRCFIPELDQYNESLGNVSQVVSHYIPNDKKGNLEMCLKYVSVNSTETMSCGGQYYFDTTYYVSSRVIEWGLVCDKRWMRALLQSIYMVGVLIGAVVAGTLADKWGRKPVLYVSAILQLIFGVLCAFMPYYYLYAITIFFYGAFGSGGAYVTGFVLSMELIGKSKRTICGTAFSFTFAIGVMVVAFWAWMIGNSQILQLVYAAHSVLLLAHWWLIDESICWLWGKGRHKEALEIASKAIEQNGKYFVKNDLPPVPNPTDLGEPKESVNKADIESCRMSQSSSVPSEMVKEPEQGGLMDLFRLPNLRFRALNMAYNWFANSLVYYGLAFNIGTLPGNPFLMSFLNGLAEVPGYLLLVLLLDKTGRRSLGCLLLFIGGFACICLVAIPEGTATITVAMLAKVAIAGSFAVCYIYAAELFPTGIRNSVVGITTMAARGAGMLAPEIVLLNSIGNSVPTIIFGIVAVISAFFALFLPETLDQPMPQTIEEGENFGKGDTAFHTFFRYFKRRRISRGSRSRLR